MCDSAHTQRTSDKLPQSAFKKLQKKLKRGKEYLIKWADDGQLIVQEKEAGQIPLESEEIMGRLFTGPQQNPQTCIW